MKVVIAADLAPAKIGSLECQLFNVGRLLEQEGCSVAYLFSGAMSPAVRDHFRLAGKPIATGLGSLGSAASHLNWLREFQRQQPDVAWLHFFPLFTPLIGRIRRACPDVRICLSDRVSRGYPRRNLLKTAFCRGRSALLTRRVDQYIAVSQFVAGRLREVDYVSEQRIHMIYNGVDLERFHPRHSEGSYLAAICHMRPEKGVHVLLEALRLLKEQGQEPECRLVGIGPELENYRSFASDHELRHVHFLGSRDDVPEILQEARLAVVPSTFAEAFGLAAAEAQAAGTPVVASRLGALPEVVEDRVSGLLVPPGNPAALAAAISELLQNPELGRSMGDAGRSRVERLFDLKQQARLLAERVAACQELRPGERPAWAGAGKQGAEVS